MNGHDDRNPYRRRQGVTPPVAPADATRTRVRDPSRHPEVRAAEPSLVDQFARALVTTAAEYFNLGDKPIQSPRRRRDRMRTRAEIGNLIVEPEDYESSPAEMAGEAAGHLLPVILMNRGAPLSPAAFRGAASVGEAAAGGYFAPHIAGVTASDEVSREQALAPVRRLLRRDR